MLGKGMDLLSGEARGVLRGEEAGRSSGAIIWKILRNVRCQEIEASIYRAGCLEALGEEILAARERALGEGQACRKQMTATHLPRQCGDPTNHFCNSFNFLLWKISNVQLY